jgi:site-specific recombinase XerD
VVSCLNASEFLRNLVQRCVYHAQKQVWNDGVDTRTIQAYLGHKSIQHAVRYTELAPTRFKSLFRD